jgi:hypothetical protein
MAKLIYASNASLDGCTEDTRGAFDWATPDDEVFAFIADLMRSAGTYLHGQLICWRDYTAWAERHGYESMPADPASVAHPSRTT